MSAAEAAELESAKTSEEQDPFSIFRNASDSQPFGSHDWVVRSAYRRGIAQRYPRG